jgi:hypothetical protein
VKCQPNYKYEGMNIRVCGRETCLKIQSRYICLFMARERVELNGSTNELYTQGGYLHRHCWMRWDGAVHSQRDWVDQRGVAELGEDIQETIHKHTRILHFVHQPHPKPTLSFVFHWRREIPSLYKYYSLVVFIRY